MPIRSYSKNDGTAYTRLVSGSYEQYSHSPYANNGILNEILNPRILRMGARFEF
jgi:hypothetical protein